jgi:hypothetical protein
MHQVRAGSQGALQEQSGGTSRPCPPEDLALFVCTTESQAASIAHGRSARRMPRCLPRLGAGGGETAVRPVECEFAEVLLQCLSTRVEIGAVCVLRI